MDNRSSYRDVWKTVSGIIVTFAAISFLTEWISESIQNGQSTREILVSSIVDTTAFVLVGLPVVFITVKHAVASVREADNKFITLVRNNSTGFFIYQDDKFQYVNPKFAELMEYDKQDFMGGNISIGEIVAPEDLPLIQSSACGPDQDTHNTNGVTVRCRTKRGRHIWAEIYATQSTYLGRPAVIGTVIDRTAHEKMERELWESKEALVHATEQLQNIFHTVNVLLYSASPDFDVVLEMSPGAERVFGITREEFIEHPSLWLDYVHPDDRPTLSRAAQDLRQGMEVLIEYRIKHRVTGEQRWVQARMFPVRDEVGKVIRVNGVTFDITEKKRFEQELSKKEQQYRSLFEHNPDAVYSMDTSGRFTDINPAGPAIIGYPNEEMIGSHFAPFIETGQLANVTEAFHRVLEGEKQQFELTVIHKNGSHVQLQWSGMPIVVDGQIVGIHGIAKDVTKQKKDNMFLQGQKQILEMIAKGETLHRILRVILNLAEEQMEGALCTIFTYDPKSNHLFYAGGPSIPQSFIDGVGAVEVGPAAGSSGTAAFLREFIVVERIASDPRYKAYRDLALAHDLRACWTIPILSADRRVLGTFSTFYRSERRPTDHEIERVMGLTYLAGLAMERKQSEEYIEHLAYFDALTDLPNRRLFLDKLREALDATEAQDQHIGLIYLDVDRFKQINDTLGHANGDLFLQEVSQRLKSCVRETDLLARMSGDEFTILLPGIHTALEATEVAERITEVFRKPFVLNNNDFYVTTSMGIALYPDDADDLATLMRNADVAMYAAKSLGRDAYRVYEKSMSGKSYETLLLQSSMSKALQNQEFVLHYQPRISTETDVIVGAEALIRWIHPIRGMISPCEFIPLAEESGFIVTLGKWIIHEACKQAKVWQDGVCPPIRIAVNVSARQFLQNDLVQTVADALQQTGLDAKYLEIEITESTIMKHEYTVLGILNELKSMGVHISIDDFGTGYSSLSYLKQFNVDALKIDQSFVKGIPNNANDMTIAGTVITLAHAMDLRVIAEGVETETQRDFLKERECDELQGHLLGHPVPPEDFPWPNP